MRMKIQVTRKQEVEVTHARLKLAVRYEEEDMPKDYPHRKGDLWDIRVNLTTGQICDWPKGVPPRKLDMKVCDEGSYYLLDAEGKHVAKREDDYVPGFVPGEYGDYIGFDIDADGRITNWSKTCTPSLLQAFVEGEEDED